MARNNWHNLEWCTYITPREIPTLEHEARDNPMEFATLVTKPLLSRAKSAEVLSGLWHNVAVELEDDSSRWACAGQGFSAEPGRCQETKVRKGLPSLTVRSK